MKPAPAPLPPEPLTRRQRLVVRLFASLALLMGGMMLLKVVLTLREGTAWDDLGSAAREAQPFEYWSFVVTYLVLGVGIGWLGVNLWRSR